EPLVVTLAPLSLRGVPPPPFCPLLLLLLRPTLVVLSRSVLRLPLVGAVALAGARGAGALVGVAGAVAVVVEAVGGVGVVVGVLVVVEVSAAAVEAVAAVAAAGVVEAVEVVEAAEAVVELVAEVHRGVAPVVVSASSSSAVLRPPPLSSFVSGTLGVSAVEVLAPAPTFSVPETALFPDATEIPRWGDLSRAGVAVFDLEYDAILAAMYALSTSDEGDCYLCVPPDPGIEAAALGATSRPGTQRISLTFNPGSPCQRPACPACTSRRTSRPRPPAVPGTHQMALRPSTVPLRVPLPSPPGSSLPAFPDPESDSLRAASPTVARFLATVVTDPSLASTAASALVAELVDFAASCRLDYATSLVAESASVCPPSVECECALSTDVFEDRQEEFQCFAAALPHLVSTLLAHEGDPDAPDIPTPRSYAEAIKGPYSSQWQAAMDADMASWKSTGTYVDEVPPPRANIAPREWHDTLRTTLAALGFAPSTADPSLFLRTDTSLPPFYVLVYVDDLVFATADTAGLAHVKSELQKRHTCTDLGELRSYLGLQITRDRAQRTITLTQSHMVQQVLQRFDFTYSLPQATPLSTRHSLSALPSDESVEPSGPYPELVGCLMYLMTCTRPDLAYPLSILARYVAPGRHRPEHMAAAKRVLRYLCSTSGMGSSGPHSSSCEAEIYAGALAAQELRWLTYLLTDLGEQPRSPPVLYVDNKAMLALCREHRLEHRTKHIALRYFLARELQQRGQLRLAYVASEANTADIFTKALAPGDHQRFCTLLEQQQRSPETPSPQQLREWYAGRQRGGGTGPCTYVLRTGDRTGEQCGGPHSTQRCFGRLTDAWRHQFPDATEIPRWGDLSRAGDAVFDLDYDAILAAMYALSTSDEGDCYLCVPPDPGIAAAALGAGGVAP
ncbi:unnamed protein product, partial [Closterium sp. NIES-54]